MSGAKKKAILSIEGLMDQPVNVKMTGGREVCGVLKGYDKDLNLVLDETREFLRDKMDPLKRRLSPDPNSPGMMVEETRYLGVIICKGTLVCVISPHDGIEEIENPFAEEE
eukprot:TRINITY_DN20565_c0_g1_i1.p1 TRINITY_DN20565_c0_g1~~TRINITY_DN20565_c0_g1_i1.p1  ORF type:complete len:111 (+),score=27.92 TRINITY_DN20565_c0_g1_i1:76-408(+)